MTTAQMHGLKRSYIHYRCITREEAFAAGFDGRYLNCGPDQGPSKVYDYRQARKLLSAFDKAVAVDFAQPPHNGPNTRYDPPHGYILYVKSSPNGQKRRVRFGEGVDK